MNRFVRRLLVLCAVATLAAAAAPAQPASRDVFVTVLDGDGTPVTGLEPSHFAVREDGRDRQVVGLEQIGVAMHVALLLDTGPTAGSRLSTIKSAASAFVDVVGPGHRIALYSFGDRATPELGFTDDPSALKEAIQRLFARTNPTRLIDAVEMAARDLKAAGAARPVIVAIATTDADVSSRSAGSAIKLLVAEGVPLHVVAVKAQAGTTTAAARGVENQFNQSRERMNQLISAGEGSRELTQLLEDGTAQSGGSLDRVASLEAAGPGLTRVVSRLRYSYRLTYASPTPASRRPKNLQVGIFAEGVTVRASVPPQRPGAAR